MGTACTLIYTIVILVISLYLLVLLVNFLKAGTEAFHTYIENNKKF